MKFDINNPKSVKMFNHTYMRGCFHHKRRIRKKNYHRAQKLLFNLMKIKHPSRQILRMKVGADKIKWLKFLFTS